VWWTFDKADYARALEEPAERLTEGAVIAVQQAVWRDSAPLEKQLEALDGVAPEGAAARASVRHVIRHHLLHRHLFYEDRSAPIFDVTPDCMRALFTVEFMQWYLLMAHQASANDLATLNHAVAMIDAAEKGWRDPNLERQADALFPEPGDRRVFEQFRDYAWRCAATAVPRDLFERSIALHEGPSDLAQGGVPEEADGGVSQAPAGGWLRAATRIHRESATQRHGPAVHPYLAGASGPTRGFVREGPMLTIEQQKLLVAYFNNYLFGASLRKSASDDEAAFSGTPVQDDYRARLRLRTDEWEHQTGEVRTRARLLLRTHAAPESLFLALASCYLDHDDLTDRYIDAAAFAGCLWWEQLNAETPTHEHGSAREVQRFWKRFKTRTKTLAERQNGNGRISKLLHEQLGAYQLTLQQAQVLLETVGRLEAVFAGHDVGGERLVPASRAHATLEPSGGSGQVRVTLQASGHASRAPGHVTVRFVRRDPGQTGFHPVERTGQRTVELPADPSAVREASGFSSAFCALAEALNLTLALVSVARAESAKDHAFAVFDVAKSALGIADSFPGALAAIIAREEQWKPARALANLAKLPNTWLGRMDGLLKLYKGHELLVGDDADLQYALRRGHTFQAQVQRFAGVANIVAGLPAVVDLAGVGAAALGTGEWLGLSPLLMAGFSATPWGLLFAVGGSLLIAASALLVDLAQPWDENLAKLEGELDAAERREIRGKRFKMSIAVDDMLAAIKESWP
jgi:hypothetical protein